MHASAGIFSVKMLTASSTTAEVDEAIHIFECNTPPRLRTDSEEIRKKIAAPELKAGVRYFAALYRGPALIGFAMFGYYPSTKLVIIDHMVIQTGERGDSAFAVFTGLLIDQMDHLAVDYIAIEVELESESRASGITMMRRLTRNEFGKATVNYRLPATDTTILDGQFDGALLLRSMQEAPDDFVQIQKAEIERIVETIYFKHYYDWYSDVWSSAKLKLYRTYINALFKEFKSGIQKEYVPISHYIKKPSEIDPLPPPPRHGMAFYFLMFAVTAAICGSVIYLLKVPFLSAPIILIGFLAVFAGIVLVANGGAWKVLDAALKATVKGRGTIKTRTTERMSE